MSEGFFENWFRCAAVGKYAQIDMNELMTYIFASLCLHTNHIITLNICLSDTRIPSMKLFFIPLFVFDKVLILSHCL
jgi:hypothetical protein